jgi:hypothetical protein
MKDKNYVEHENRRFYIYGILVGDADLVLTIPAENSEEAHAILSDVVKDTTRWTREKETEIKMGFDKTDTAGKRRPKEWHELGCGPMYG